MIDIQLEILQPEFAALIGSVIDYEPNATQHIGVSCSGGRGSHEPCFMPGAQQVVCTLSAEPPVNNLPFGKFISSMPTQLTIDTEMQQLSLNDHQNQRFMVTAAGDAFVPSGNTHGNPMPPSNLHSTPMYMHG